MEGEFRPGDPDATFGGQAQHQTETADSVETMNRILADYDRIMGSYTDQSADKVEYSTALANLRIAIANGLVLPVRFSAESIMSDLLQDEELKRNEETLKDPKGIGKYVLRALGREQKREEAHLALKKHDLESGLSILRRRLGQYLFTAAKMLPKETDHGVKNEQEIKPDAVRVASQVLTDIEVLLEAQITKTN